MPTFEQRGQTQGPREALYTKRAAARPKANGHASERASAPSPFDLTADTLISNDYSAVALVRKRPIDDRWSAGCKAPPTPEEIAARKGRCYNIGVACGYSGLVGIDIDTDRPEIAEAVNRIVQSPVVKRGQRGCTVIGRTAAPIASQRFYGPNGDILVEVLGDGRQMVIPPSIHPDTQRPYEWLGPATLLNTPVGDLPLWPDDVGIRLRKELAPFLRPEKTPRPQRSGPPPILTDAMHKRHRAWALKAIGNRVEELAAKQKPGRNDELFKYACTFGKFVHHGLISDSELRKPAHAACATNGLAKDNGPHDCEKTIDNGLRYALSDVLEDLEGRPHQARSQYKKPERGRTFEEPKGSEEGGAEPPPDTTALEFDDQIEIETSVNALVKGILHPGDIAALYGPSGAGKTFTAIDLAYHIALGRPWHGRRVRQAPVLYVGLEGVRGLRHRMKAYSQHMGSAGHMLARLAIHAPLDRSEVGNGGEASIIANAKALGQKAGKRIGLIIIDTLARAIAGDDENSAQDMAAFVGRMSAIARETGAAVLVVHHPGKDDARGMRGSTALFAACDAVVKIASNGNVREVATEKVKDGVIGPLFSYRLKQVSLGTDEDGDEITSCIIEAAASSSIPRRAKLSQQHQRAYDQLLRLYTDGVARYIDPKLIGLGDIDPRYMPHVVTREEWRRVCDAAQLTNTGQAGSERVAFKRSVDELEKAGLIARYGEYVWRLGQTNPATSNYGKSETEDNP